MAGDITAPALTKLLGDTFQPVSGASAAAAAQCRPAGRSPACMSSPMPVPQPTAMFGLPGIMRADPGFHSRLCRQLHSGRRRFSSRLTDEVRVKRGLTYGISTALDRLQQGQRDAGLGRHPRRRHAPDHAGGEGHAGEFRRRTAPRQQELDDAKTYLTGSFPLAFASNAGTASQLSTFQRQGLDIGYVARRNALIQAVTLDDVKRVAKRLFDPARLTVVVGGSPVEGRAAPQGRKPPVRPTHAAQGTADSRRPLRPQPPGARSGHASASR